MSDETRLDEHALGNLRDMVGQDEGVLAELIHSFLDDAPRIIRSLEGSVAVGDAPNVRLHAHSLKGNANDFGALDLAALCLDMELAGKSGDLSAAPRLMASIRAAYPPVERALRRLLASMG